MAMIREGSPAPDFELPDQFGRPVRLSRFRGRGNFLMLFYPLDFTPTCSMEVPELNALAPAFAEQANTYVVAVNADSRFAHNAWCAQMGGVRMSILSDAHPHGAVSKLYGAWIPGESISDRATVIVDRQGVVRYAKTVGKNGRRDIAELLSIATRIDEAQRPAQGAPARARGPLAREQVQRPRGWTIYVRERCGHCHNALRAMENAGILDAVKVKVLEESPGARAELIRLAGSDAVPVLVIEGRGYLLGAEPILALLAAEYAR